MTTTTNLPHPSCADVGGNVRTASGTLYPILLMAKGAYATYRPGSASPLFVRYFDPSDDASEERALEAAISYAHSYDAMHMAKGSN